MPLLQVSISSQQHPPTHKYFYRFSSLDKQDKGYLSREDFLRIPELAINPLGDRIVHAFFFESRSGDEDKVDFKDFVRVLAHFRPIKKSAEKNKLNTRMEKLHFAFRMYDLDGDDKISKEELLAVLTMMVGNNISTEQLISIAERTIHEADLDKVIEEYCNDWHLDPSINCRMT